MPEELDTYAASGDTGEVTPPPEAAGGVSDAPAAEEDFLVVNERTRYKTREEAARGVGEKENRLGQYAKFGSPETIAERLERLDAIEAATKPKANGGNEPTPEEIELNRKWFERFGPSLGILTQDQIDRQQSQRIGELADNYGKQWLTEHEISATPEEIEAVGNFGVALVNSDQRLNRMFFNGQHQDAVDEILSRYYGAQIASRESKMTEAERQQARDQRGRYAQAQVAGDKIKALPKAPPKTGAAAAKGPEKVDLSTPEARKKRAMELMDERGMLGAAR